MVLNPEFDSLESLDERIQQAVNVVSRLRQAKDAALEKVAKANAETARLMGEVKSLQAERKQVRGRIEKLVGQIDGIS